MSKYKAPRSREAIKNMVKKLLTNWVDENLDDSGETSTIWDDADDSAAVRYQDEIEDGKSHTAAMKEAKLRFWEELKDGLGSQIEGVFERIDK